MPTYDQDPRARARRVADARTAVAAATVAYSRGGSCDAVNKANSELADATYAMSNPGCPIETGRQK